jgi:tetratricopeptide (TPR) repeat protein
MPKREADAIAGMGGSGLLGAGAAGGSAWSSGSVVLMLLAGIAATGTFATLFTVIYRSASPGTTDSLRIALDEYVAGRFEVAKRLAERVEPNLEEQPEQYQIREFLLGAAGIQLADQLETPKQTRLEIAGAVPHLEWLAVNEFPPGRAAEGQRLLGLGLKVLGRFEQAIPPLDTAINQDPTLARELLLPLAECKLRAPGGQFVRAMKDVDRFLEIPNLTVEAQNEANLLKARIFSMMQNWPSAYETLSQITTPDVKDDVKQSC